jgi:hypothetical protein
MGQGLAKPPPRIGIYSCFCLSQTENQSIIQKYQNRNKLYDFFDEEGNLADKVPICYEFIMD